MVLCGIRFYFLGAIIFLFRSVTKQTNRKNKKGTTGGKKGLDKPFILWYTDLNS